MSGEGNSMSQVTNLAFFRARRGQSEAVGAALAALVEPTRLEAGCLNYDLHRSVDDADVWRAPLSPWRWKPVSHTPPSPHTWLSTPHAPSRRGAQSSASSTIPEFEPPCAR